MKTKQLKTKSEHPLNAKEFIAWLQQEIERHPEEIQNKIEINYDHLNRFGHPYLALEVPKS